MAQWSGVFSATSAASLEDDAEGGAGEIFLEVK